MLTAGEDSIDVFRPLVSFPFPVRLVSRTDLVRFAIWGMGTIGVGMEAGGPQLTGKEDVGDV